MKRFISASYLLVLVFLVPLAARAQEVLPTDVYPNSRNRLPSLGADAPTGVDGIRPHGTGGVVRWESPLGRALTELAILTIARELDQPYEWSLHEMEGLAVGLEPRVIDIVRNRQPLTELSEKESLIIELGRELLREHELSIATYARAEDVLGIANLVDIVSLMGDYVATGVRLTAFNQQLPPGFKQFLPLPFTEPDDIHPDSRSRLPYVENSAGAEAVTPLLYSRQLAPAGTGPGQIRRHGSGLESLEASVGTRLTRLASLIAARELDDVYQWTTNEIAAAEDGLEAAIIDLVRRRAPATGLAEEDAALIEFGRELLGEHTVSAPTYAHALRIFGESDLVDFIELMAQHAHDATLLIAFQQQLPAGQEPLLPIL
jgi:hypothetical protein